MLIQAPVPPRVIDKNIPGAMLLAWILAAKYSDHLPLYRLERIFARAGLAIPRSTLGARVGVCGVQLQPLVDALHLSGALERRQSFRHARTGLGGAETAARCIAPAIWSNTSSNRIKHFRRDVNSV